MNTDKYQGIEIGMRVRVKIPTLHGIKSVGGTVRFLRPDGRIEVKVPNHGYEVAYPAELEIAQV